MRVSNSIVVNVSSSPLGSVWRGTGSHVTSKPGNRFHLSPRRDGDTYELGYNIATMRDYVRRDVDDVLAGWRPAWARQRGVASPPAKACRFCVASGLNVVAVDINTVSPPHDVHGMAAHLAAQVTFECLLPLTERRSGDVAS